MRSPTRLTLSCLLAIGLNFAPACSCGAPATGASGTSATTGGRPTTTSTSSGASGTAGASGSSSGSTGGNGSGCGLVTCASAKANCGPLGDGCGDILQCGSCTAPETCGGGGVPSRCGGMSGCVPKTCAEASSFCGPTGDGCGDLIDGGCGSCALPETCGGGGAPFHCGGASTGSATAGATNGSSTGATSGATSGGGCVPLTCADFDAGCGLIGDGCGHSVACGGCDAGGFCGGGGIDFQCGYADAGSCVPLSCGALDAGCGYAGDGCGGVVDCGGCDAGGFCGGGGVPNQCGNLASDGGACVGLCKFQISCDGGSTSISGTVFAATNPAAGFGQPDPIPNATVYIPNDGTVQPFTSGAVCDVCGAPVSGNPLVITTSMEDGGFTLTNVPVSDAGFNLVVQLGRWRREVAIPPVAACTNTVLTPDQTRFPRNHLEGDIPLIAMVTGNVDTTECVLRKMGIDDSEFTAPGIPDAGRVQIWVGNGATDPQGVAAQELTLTSSLSTLEQYDQVIFSCWGTENGQPASPDQPVAQIQANQQAVTEYANAGGRIYATHFSYVWLENDPGQTSLTGPVPFNTTADWDLNAGSWPSTCGTSGGRHPNPLPCPVNIDQSFPKGMLLAEWLETVGASTTVGVIPSLDYPRWDMDDVVIPPSENWLQWPGNQTPLQPYTPLHYTFNTPVDAGPSGAQCGRVVFSDFHVENANNAGSSAFPGECTVAPMTAQEKVLEFMLFDLSSCVSQSGGGSVCPPLNCAQQGDTCGQAGDGCGGILQCGYCDAGGVCSGIPGTCQTQASGCQPRTCVEYGFTCGQAGDGCGNLIGCGGCDAGGTCGGGGVTGQCGSQPGTDGGVADGGSGCVPESCAAQGLFCGAAGDGCGNVINCGGCDGGATCGGGGVQGVCGLTPCTPQTCAQLGYTCGAAGDGCGGLIQCGICDAGTCGGGFFANHCGSPTLQ